jgi:hypothetical protein
MINLNKKIQNQFNDMCKSGKLFRVAMSGQEIWDLYLKSFTKEEDPIFRDPDSSIHNCNHCKNFIRRYGNIVSVDENYDIVSMFDVEAEDEFINVTKILSKTIKNSKIVDVFFETFDELNSLPYESCSKSNSVFRLGIDKNHKRYTKEEAEKFGVVKPNEIRTFNHFHLDIPKEFVDMSKKSIEAIMGEYRDAKNVFQRAMVEISLDTLNLVKDLINQGSLLDGATHLYKIEQIIPLKVEYDKQSNKDSWCWVNSYNLKTAKFRNEAIGKLCSDLSEGKELNEACQMWNKMVDPANYMKAIAPITKKQIEEAQKFVEENGYVESFDRRFATIEDIKASEILHINSGKGDIKTVSIFDNVKSTSTRHKRSEFDGVEEVSIEKFMKDILPSCTSVEVLLKNNHEKNMVSLTTATIKESKPIFKWSNNYSWTFNGNLAGKSQIKEAVKSAGGKVDGVLRFSIAWNKDGRSICDFDAHAIEPNRTEIYYGSYKGMNNKTTMSGFLDVDMIRPASIGVENITWIDLSKMKSGEYKFFNRNFDGGNNTGFEAEVEFNGEIYHYECLGNILKDTPIATVTLKNGEFSIEHHLPEIDSSKEIYGLETNEFHKVNLICLSPNHWNDNNVGNKHYFFMLEKCKSPTSIRSFHNENLISDLLQHRKVMEVLGTTNMIPTTNKQLSGLGYNATVHDELIVKLSGSFKRILKIKF